MQIPWTHKIHEISNAFGIFHEWLKSMKFLSREEIRLGMHEQVKLGSECSTLYL